MRKSTFDLEPRLFEYEGQVVRINFCVEKVAEPANTTGEGEAETREVFKAYVIRLPQPLTVGSIKDALIGEGFEENQAEAYAAEIMLTGVQGGELSGDELKLARQMMVARIRVYDLSDSVNSFTLDGKSHWIPREDRVIYEARLAEDKERGRETIRFELPDADPADEPLTLPIAQAEAMLKQLKYYATDSFDVTQDHIRAVNALNSVKEVIEYDYTVGYPEKKSFTTAK